MTMLISVITPTLNSHKYIGECIKSVENQNFNNYEHIIIDGGSQDNTIAICKKFKNLNLIIKKGSSVYKAYNVGISKAKGEFIFILNSDDKLENNAFKKFLESYNKNKECDLYASNGLEFETLTNKILRKRYFTNSKFFSRGIIKFNSQSILGCYIKKDIFKRLDYFSLLYSISADKKFLINLGSLKMKCNNINHFSYLIRSHSESLTFGKKNQKIILETINQNLKIIYSQLELDGIPLGVKYFCVSVLLYRKIQLMRINIKNKDIHFLINILSAVPNILYLIVYFIPLNIYKIIISLNK